VSSIFDLTGGVGPNTDQSMGGVRGLPRPSAREVTELVEHARQGNRDAIGQLFRVHLPSVHRVVYRLVGPASDVDDLVQTVFIEAFRSLAGFRGDAMFSTWLTRIAVRVTIRDRKRWRSRQPVLAAMSWPDGDATVAIAGGASNPERTVAAREGLRVLDALLAELRPKRRAAFVLHVLEGHAMDEVAAILNASTSAVKVRVHDARRHIERRMLADPALANLLASAREGHA
jgi:RNA polymerase sigma factor (sigma-70 family)